MLKQIKDSVESGTTLAEALKKYPKEFDDLFVNMIAAGEAGGILDIILQRLSGYMEKAAKLKAQVKGALTYPVVTLIIAAIVLAVILVFVIPGVPGNVRKYGGKLPQFTQLVVDMSEFVKGYWYLFFGGIDPGDHCLQAVLQNQQGPGSHR
jgi:type IV pilus assembly protein PilC